MEVTGNTTSQQAQVVAKPTKLNSDYETFLKMLTAQMQNQDPLNPVDSGDYAVQLATFSSVEQQVMTNDLLTGLNAQMSGLGMAQFASWIGMEARVIAPIHYSGDPVEIVVAPHNLSDDVWVSVTDKDGFEVSRKQAQLGEETFSWAGTDSDGQPLPGGDYSFSIESFAQGELIDKQLAPAYSRIIEARNGPQGTTLVLEGGQEVASDLVTALRMGD